MKRELGIARCGLACCLCSENTMCDGCDSGQCPDKDWCENRKCSISRKIGHCYECTGKCRKGVIYHRDGINGDYDDFDEVEPLIEYIRTGYKQDNGGT